MNNFENGLANRVDVLNKMSVEIFANTDNETIYSENDDRNIVLGVAFRGPIFGLLCGQSISILIFIIENIYLFIYYF